MYIGMYWGMRETTNGQERMNDEWLSGRIELGRKPGRKSDRGARLVRRLGRVR